MYLSETNLNPFVSFFGEFHPKCSRNLQTDGTRFWIRPYPLDCPVIADVPNFPSSSNRFVKSDIVSATRWSNLENYKVLFSHKHLFFGPGRRGLVVSVSSFGSWVRIPPGRKVEGFLTYIAMLLFPTYYAVALWIWVEISDKNIF
jgi:hypothetical protein